MTKSTIATLIAEREEQYEENTKKIFDEYGSKLKKVVPFLINYDRNVIWENIDKYGDQSSVLCIYALVEYEKNDVIATPDGPKRVVLDGYKGKIRFIVTIDSLENLEPLEIVEEIKTLRSYEQGLSPSESYGLFNDPDFIVDLSNNKFDYIKAKLMKSDQGKEQKDFDLSKLTKEQQETILSDSRFIHDDKGTIH